MKHFILYRRIFILGCSIFFFGIIFNSCQDKITERYKVLSPIYMSYENLRQAVKAKDTLSQLNKPGKIYYWNNLLFVNENNNGIHIIDNSNPAEPIFKTFIKIPGNVDMSVKDGILYADSYVDLVAIDISNLDDIKEVNRIQNIFPYTLPAYDQGLIVENIDQTNGVVIGYTEKYVEKDYKRVINPYPIYYNTIDKETYLNNTSGPTQTTGNNTGIGIGGSLARFTISGNVLYAINDSYQLYIFNITSVENPIKYSSLYISWGIQTLFPYGNKLFIGSQSGMLIYDISNPLSPQSISTYSHRTACDPVVVDGNYAYITLRTGTSCQSMVNSLDVVDISDISAPTKIKSYDMSNPHGLGVDGNTLFVCDGDAGLKIFNITDKYKIGQNLIVQYANIKATDVIPLGGSLFMIGDDGFYQYDYTDLANVKFLSKISVK